MLVSWGLGVWQEICGIIPARFWVGNWTRHPMPLIYHGTIFYASPSLDVSIFFLKKFTFFPKTFPLRFPRAPPILIATSLSPKRSGLLRGAPSLPSAIGRPSPSYPWRGSILSISTCFVFVFRNIVLKVSHPLQDFWILYG